MKIKAIAIDTLIESEAGVSIKSEHTFNSLIEAIYYFQDNANLEVIDIEVSVRDIL